MCVLTDETKQKLITNAKQVFKVYAEFAFFDSPLNALNKKSLAAICQENLAKGSLRFNVELAGTRFDIQMATEEKPNTIRIKPINAEIPSAFPLQSFEQYNEHQKLMLLCQEAHHNFEIDKKGQVRLFNELKPGEKLGGAEHVALYNTHLITLYNIIEKLQNSEDISSLLVALAAGSGKTFVQALWMYVLYLAEVNAVFAVPDKLVDQCRVDLYALLPKAMVDKIICLRKNDTNDRIQQLEVESSQVVLASVEALLNNHFNDLMKLSADNLFLSFDEQHLLVHKEAWKIKLFELANKFLTLFLTATPSEQTYKQSGKQPVAVMSNSQKEKAGQGKFPKLYHVEAQMVSEKFGFSTYNPLKRQFWSDLAKKLILKFADTIQTESSSAALTTLEALPNLYSVNPNEHTQRFAFEMPFARKMLVITEDNEDIVNLFHAIKDSDDILNPMVYRDGNLVDRNEVYDFFRLENLDEEICRSHRSQCQTKINQEIDKALEGKQVSQNISGMNRNVKTQLKFNVLHHLIELLLQDVTGMSEIELDQMRKSDMNRLIALVFEKISPKSADYYYQKFLYHPDTNPRGIDASGAKALSTILASMSQKFPHKRYNQPLFYACVDNWTLNLQEVMNHFIRNTPNLANFIDEHLMMAVMSDMNDAEMPLKDSVPFMSLEQDQYEFHTRPEKAKVRKRTAVETLNERAVESRFSPKYLEVPETIADNYFRLGLVGMYVSNKKTEGFSDANLHTVINISNHAYSDSNNPQTLVQALGRNRGLNENVTPAFIHGTGKNAASPFKVTSLNKDDYYEDLYEAQHNFNEIYLDSISQRVSKKIILWINQHNKANDDLDEVLLKRKVLKCICQAIRELNRANGHDLRISRPQLNKVLSKTIRHIKDEIKHLEHPYKLSLFVRVVGTILNACSELYFQIKKIGPWLSLHWQQWFNRKPTSKQAYDDLYFKILKKSSYKSLVEEVSVTVEVNKILLRAKEALKVGLRDNVSDYLNQSTKEEIKSIVDKAIIPSLLKCIGDDNHAAAHRQLLAIKDWPQMLFAINEKHGRAIKDISALTKLELVELYKTLVPKLELSESDVVLPSEKEQKLKDHFSSFTPLTADLELKNALIEALAKYFQKTEFIELIKPMFDLSNHHKIAKELSKNKCRQALAAAIVSDFCILSKSKTPEMLMLHLVQKHLKLPNLRTLQDELSSTLQLQKEVNDLVSSSPFPLLDDDSLNGIGNILKKELCPIFVNFYPFDQREYIYRQAQKINYADFIKTHGNEFFEMLEKNPGAAARLLFSHAGFETDYALPEQVDEEQEKNRIQKIFTDFSRDVRSKSLSHYLYQSITNLNFFNPLQNYKYMIAVDVVEFLRSDHFKSALAFMPYDHAMFLTSLLEDNDYAYNAAYALIDKMMQRDENMQMSPLEVVDLLNESLDLQERNKLKTNEQLGQQSQEKLALLRQNMLAEPTKYLNKDLKSKYQNRIVAHVIPLLCAYINDSEKQTILTQAATQCDLLGILHKYRIELSEFGNQDELTDINKILLADICNAICSDNACFNKDDIDAFTSVIENNIQTIGHEVKVIFLSTYLQSKDCAKQLSNVFNDEDCQSVTTCLASSENDQPRSFVLANDLLHSSMHNGDISFLVNQAMIRLKQLADNNELEHVDLLPNRMKSACDYLQQLGSRQAGFADHFSLTAINQTIEKQLLPLLNHDLFIKMISSTVGFLAEEEIHLLLSSQTRIDQNNDVIKDNAKLLFEFISAIKTGNVQAIKPFLYLAVDENGAISLDSSLLPKLVDSLQIVINCVNDAHCYFEQHNAKGLMQEDYTSHFIEQLSDEVRSYRVDAKRYNFFDMFTRRIFFIQGVRNGLPNASTISAFSSQKTIERLNRINNHILRPLWWANNASNIRFTFTKLMADLHEYIVVPIAYFLINIGIGLYNACVSIFSDGMPKPLYERLPQELAYHEAGFSYAKVFNQLNDLTLEDLTSNPNCNDSIELLETFVDVLPDNLEYFDDVPDVDKSARHIVML